MLNINNTVSNSVSKAQIKKIVLLQFVVSCLTGLLGLLFSQSLALSLVAGAMVASLSNAYFGWKVSKNTLSGEKEVEQTKILSTYYGAEVGKIILTVMLFVAAFNVIKQLNVIAFMCAYLFITLIPWLASFFINDDGTNWRKENVE